MRRLDLRFSRRLGNWIWRRLGQGLLRSLGHCIWCSLGHRVCRRLSHGGHEIWRRLGLRFRCRLGHWIWHRLDVGLWRSLALLSLFHWIWHRHDLGIRCMPSHDSQEFWRRLGLRFWYRFGHWIWHRHDLGLWCSLGDRVWRRLSLGILGIRRRLSHSGHKILRRLGLRFWPRFGHWIMTQARRRVMA